MRGPTPPHSEDTHTGARGGRIGPCQGFGHSLPRNHIGQSVNLTVRLRAPRLPLPGLLRSTSLVRALGSRDDVLKLRNIGISAHIDSGKVRPGASVCEHARSDGVHRMGHLCYRVLACALGGDGPPIGRTGDCHVCVRLRAVVAAPRTPAARFPLFSMYITLLTSRLSTRSVLAASPLRHRAHTFWICVTRVDACVFRVPLRAFWAAHALCSMCLVLWCCCSAFSV